MMIMKSFFLRCTLIACSVAIVLLSNSAIAQEPDVKTRKVLLIAGPPSHDTTVIKHKWPTDEGAFDGVDAIVIYSDGGTNHPAYEHLEQVNNLAAQGVGIVCIHYAVEMTKGPSGDALMHWIGGTFETDWSVNPHWRAEFKTILEHEITRGVVPFSTDDEWYFHIRFLPEMKGVTPILTAVAPESTMVRPDGSHSGNPHVRQSVANGDPQHLAWAIERPDGGRGFGCTGGHFHWNWADKNFRRVVLNAIVWAAKGEVPEGGVPVDSLDLAALEENQDFEKPADFDEERVRQSQPDLKK
jgi:Trehalose utilisation